MYAERRTSEGWSLLGEVEPNDEHMTEADEIEPRTRPVAFFDRRNSDLFSILAGVNGLTVDVRCIDGIASPRGLPPDLSLPVRTWFDFFEEVHPANSWLALSELLRVDWHGKHALREAMVSKRVAPLFRDPRSPFPKAQWPADEPITYARMSRDGIRVRWTDSYAQIAGSDFLEALESLSALGDPSTMRLVFWFTQ